MMLRDPERSIRDLNTLRAPYLENSWRCYLATIANYYTVSVRHKKLHSYYSYNNFAKLCHTMMIFGK